MGCERATWVSDDRSRREGFGRSGASVKAAEYSASLEGNHLQNAIERLLKTTRIIRFDLVSQFVPARGIPNQAMRPEGLWLRRGGGQMGVTLDARLQSLTQELSGVWLTSPASWVRTMAHLHVQVHVSEGRSRHLYHQDLRCGFRRERIGDGFRRRSFGLRARLDARRVCPAGMVHGFEF
jgi:hypothetical protein